MSKQEADAIDWLLTVAAQVLANPKEQREGFPITSVPSIPGCSICLKLIVSNAGRT